MPSHFKMSLQEIRGHSFEQEQAAQDSHRRESTKSKVLSMGSCIQELEC